ncbi:uncharacterized protein LOC144494006 [Mustelus asterias]
MATLSISTEHKGPKRSEDFVKSIKTKTVEMMFLVTVAYCLLLPLSHSKVEANQYCSAQESSVSHYSIKGQSHESHENEKTTKDIQYAKGFYYADMNLENTNFKTIADYVKKIVFPFSVNIPGTKTILTIFNLNITDECNYNDNETVCDICYDYVQNYTARCGLPAMECSNSSICNSSHLGMDEVGFYPENVPSLTLEGQLVPSYPCLLNLTAITGTIPSVDLDNLAQAYLTTLRSTINAKITMKNIAIPCRFDVPKEPSQPESQPL